MRIIATGCLQITVFKNINLEVLQNAMIRIYKMAKDEVVFEDFFMTKVDGKTQPIPLYAPSEEASLKEGIEHYPYEEYALELRCKGYRRQVIKGIQMFANECTVIHLVMEPEDCENAEEVTIKQIEQHALVKKKQSLEIANAISTKKKIIIPDSILVKYRDSEQLETKIIEVKFLDYVKKCACCMFYPTWSKTSLQANILILMTLIIECIMQKEYQKKGYDFDISYQDFLYNPYQNMFPKITDVVEDVFGKILFYDESQKNKKDILWNPWLINRFTQQKSNCSQILHAFFQKEIIIKHVEIKGTLSMLSYLPFDIGKNKRIQALVKKKLYELKKYETVLPYHSLECKGRNNLEGMIRIFQQQFDLVPSGRIDKHTFLKVVSVYETIENNKYEQDPVQLTYSPEQISVIQTMLQKISLTYKEIPFCKMSGIIEKDMEQAVFMFQNMLGLIGTGRINNRTFFVMCKMFKEL